MHLWAGRLAWGTERRNSPCYSLATAHVHKGARLAWEGGHPASFYVLVPSAGTHLAIQDYDLFIIEACSLE